MLAHKGLTFLSWYGVEGSLHMYLVFECPLCYALTKVKVAMERLLKAFGFTTGLYNILPANESRHHASGIGFSHLEME